MIIFGDPHIEEKNIDELEDIFSEIIFLKNDKYEDIVCLGDYYHNNRPTAREIEFGTKWAVKFTTDRNFVVLRGNHPRVSVTEKLSSVEYLKYLDVIVENDLIWENTYFAHKETEKSEMFYGREHSHPDYFVSTKDLEKYRLVLLGHQHKFQQISTTIYHLGSCIFNSFNELDHKRKYIVKLADKLKLIELKSPIPMLEVKSVKELDKVDSKTKVRLKFESFEQFKKEINLIKKDRFYQFKIKLDFSQSTTTTKKSGGNLQSLISSWLKNIEDKDIQSILKGEFINVDRNI